MNCRTLIIFQILLSLSSSSFSADLKPLPRAVDYKLELKIDYNRKKLYGKCVITFANETGQPVDVVPVLLYRLLTVSHVRNGTRDSLPFTQKVVGISGAEKIQANFIEITLNKTLFPGEEGKIELEYEGYLLGYSREGWLYVRDNIDRNFTIIRTDGFGYPLIGYPNNNEMINYKTQYNYQLRVTVPDDLVAATGGELTGMSETGGETTFLFRSKVPSWRLDIAISHYQIYQAGENKVYYFPQDSAGAEKINRALLASYKLYTGWFGPLDNFRGYSVIEVPEGYSSQKDVTAIILTSDNFIKSKDMVAIYHEMAHSWNVTSLDIPSSRLESEGFAQFSQFLLLEKLDGKKNAVSDAAQWYLEKVRSAFNEKKEYQTVPICKYGITDMTDYSYTLGMVVFALLYDLAGQDLFNNMIGSFYREFHSRGATLDDFVDHCKKVAPSVPERFFNDWIYTTSGIRMVMEGKSFDDLVRVYMCSDRRGK